MLSYIAGKWEPSMEDGVDGQSAPSAGSGPAARASVSLWRLQGTGVGVSFHNQSAFT